MFEDTDGDGRADRITTFFEGTTWTMNIGIHPDGSVYVATRDEIFRLRDTDGDGRADERTPIAHLEPRATIRTTACRALPSTSTAMSTSVWAKTWGSRSS